MTQEDNAAAVRRDSLAFRQARLTLEDELRKQMAVKLEKFEIALAESVRKMYDEDPTHNKSAIGRAMQNKNRATVDALLALTEDPTIDLDAFAFAAFEAPQEDHMDYDEGDKLLKVFHNGQHATFDVDLWDDGTLSLDTHDPLWNSDYSVKNEIVAKLDGVLNPLVKHTDPLQEKVLAFMKGKL